ncbi:MAG: peptidoglycan editing factor PgeF [Acuticoccus sp.]
MTVSDTKLEPIAAASLTGAGVRHGFFGREGGVSQGIYASLNAGRGSSDTGEDVDENRRRIAAHFDLPAHNLVSMHQVHSATALVVDTPPAERPRVDALVTRTPGLALGVLHADCAPVLFADAQAGIVGAAHSGWRGATGGILEATVAAMVGLGARPARMVAVIGPTIAQASYEVGPEFPAPVIDAHPEAAGFFAPAPRQGHHLFDLPGYIAMRLTRAGIGTVEDLALDTYADERRFFSYRRATHRREPDYGRLVSVIVLEG